MNIMIMPETGNIEADKIFGEYLQSKCLMLEKLAERLDVSGKGDNHLDLAKSILLELGDEVRDDGDDTLFTQIDRIESILESLGEYPD